MVIGNTGFSVASFLLGMALGSILGFLLRGVLDSRIINKLEPKHVVLYTVLIIFTMSMFIQLFIDPTRETSPFLYGLMGAIVGFFFTPLGGIRNGDKKDS